MKSRIGCAIIFGALCLSCVTASFLAPATIAQPVQARVPTTDQGLKLDHSEERIGKRTFQVSKMVVSTPPSAVFNVLTDYDRTTSIFSNVSKCKVVGSNRSGKLVSFQIAVPGNLRFNYVLEVKETYPNLIQWRRVSGAFKANEGHWKLEPINNGKSTLVTYSKFVDGGFFFPQFLVNRELRQAMPEVMASLKFAAEQSYTIAKATEKTLRAVDRGI